MSKKKSLRKLYGWIIQNLEDTSKKTEQIIPKSTDKLYSTEQNKYIFYGGYDDDDGIQIETIKNPGNNILYKYNNSRRPNTFKKGNKSKISISYHKPKNKIFFGSKTTTKKYNSKCIGAKKYGHNDRNYDADISMKQLKKLSKERKIKILKN